MLRCLGMMLGGLEKGLGLIPFFRGRMSREHFSPDGFAGIDRKTTSKLVRLSLLAFSVILVRCFIYIQAFGIRVGFFEFSLLFSIGYALSSLGLTPGNLGIAELGWFGVLTLIGVGRDEAVFFAIGKRIIDMGAIVLMTAGSYIYYIAQKKGRVGFPAREQENKRSI